MKKFFIPLLISLCFVFSAVPVMAAIPFNDVSSSDWFYNDVNFSYNNSLFSGTSPTTFDPYGGMTRGMFATVLGRFAKIDPKAYSYPSNFSDVAQDQYYTPYINWAYKSGIVDGIGNNKFAPNMIITREQMARVVFWYAAGGHDGLYTDPNNVSKFADDYLISSWAKTEVGQLRFIGIVSGDNNGNFNPQNAITRSEAASIFVRLYNQIKNSTASWRASYAYVINNAQSNFLLHDINQDNVPELFLNEGMVITFSGNRIVKLTNDGGFIAQTELLFPSDSGIYYQIHHRALTKYTLSNSNISESLLLYWYPDSSVSSGYAFFNGAGSSLNENYGWDVFNSVNDNCTSISFTRYTGAITEYNISSFVR